MKPNKQELIALRSLKDNGYFKTVLNMMINQLVDLNQSSMSMTEPNILLKNRGEALMLQRFIDATKKAQE